MQWHEESPNRKNSYKTNTFWCKKKNNLQVKFIIFIYYNIGVCWSLVPIHLNYNNPIHYEQYKIFNSANIDNTKL